MSKTGSNKPVPPSNSGSRSTSGRDKATGRFSPADLFSAYLAGIDAFVLVLDCDGIVVEASESVHGLFADDPSPINQRFSERIVDASGRQEFDRWLEQSVASEETNSQGGAGAIAAWQETIRVGSQTPNASPDQTQPIRMECYSFCQTTDNQTVCFVTLRNSESRLEREEQLTRWALTDPLTELSNRRGFQQILESKLGSPLLLAILDIDHFKNVNDQFGHPVGDQTIQRVARVLTEQFELNNVARLGGDEFGVIYNVTADEIESQPDKFANLLLAVENSQQEELSSVTISGGIVVDLTGEMTARELLTAADKALYQSKTAGRNEVTFIQH